jgi:hypothetical protein
MPQKLDKSARGAYDVIVYIDGSEVVAEDSNGRKIVSKDAITGFSDLLEYIDARFSIHGTIFLEHGDHEYTVPEYIINRRTYLHGGTYIKSNGAVVGVTCNDVALDFNLDDGMTGYNELTGLEGLYFTGTGDAATGVSAYIAKILNIGSNNLQIKNVRAMSIYNLFNIVGGCFAATIDNVISWNTKGYGIKAESAVMGFDNAWHGPQGLGAHRTEVYFHNSYPGNFIATISPTPDGHDIVVPYSYRISDCWSEGFETGISGNVDSLHVSKTGLSSAVSATATAIKLDGKGSIVTECEIYGHGKYGIDIRSPEYIPSYVDKCAFIWNGVNTAFIGIGSSGSDYATVSVSNNFFNSVYNAIGSSKFAISRFENNDFYHNTIGINLLSGCVFNHVQGNTFFYVPACIAGSTNNSEIIGNLLTYSCAGIFYGSNCIVKNNVGWLTANNGTSTGTGSEQTIAHGLAAIPTGCKAWIKYLVGSRYITEMIPFDATNIYPTVTSGLAYEWRIE